MQPHFATSNLRDKSNEIDSETYFRQKFSVLGWSTGKLPANTLLGTHFTMSPRTSNVAHIARFSSGQPLASRPWGRRDAIVLAGCLAGGWMIAASGCASHQYGHLLSHQDKDLVGSHSAGAATWNPLVDEAVAKLLGRCPPPIQPVGFESHSAALSTSLTQGTGGPEVIGSALVTGPATVCFIGIENKSAEELLDFKDQLYERIDSQINTSDTFRGISRRMVDAALVETRLRPDALYLPHNRQQFAAALGRQGSPVDYLLYAVVTSGTTDRNRSTQRDYVLTMEMVNLHTGDTIKESAKIRKGYSKTRAGKWWNFGFFDQADG